jgi:ABC-type lipoprotein release transport system permease subunit
MAAELYGVSFWDPFASTIAAGSLAVCAVVAAILPAAHAAAISPVNALRAE